MKLKRRREVKTNYKTRLKILLADKPRIVVRRSLNNVLIQLVEYDKGGDRILFSAHSNELRKIGWGFNNGNIPSAYLTGFLFGSKLNQQIKKDEFILDIGLVPSIKGSRIYAALKGMVDSGLNTPHSKEIFPSEDRIKGKHISNDIEKVMEELKKKIKG